MAGLIKRGDIYYAQVYEGGKQRRICLRTDSYQLAKDKIRQIESARLRGEELPLPTRTPIPDVLSAYLQFIAANKTRNGAKKDAYRLRDLFGPVCPELASLGSRGKPRAFVEVDQATLRPDQIRADAFEALTTPYLAGTVMRNPSELAGLSR